VIELIAVCNKLARPLMGSTAPMMLSISNDESGSIEVAAHLLEVRQARCNGVIFAADLCMRLTLARYGLEKLFVSILALHVSGCDKSQPRQVTTTEVGDDFRDIGGPASALRLTNVRSSRVRPATFAR